jgi:hypothetical protein
MYNICKFWHLVSEAARQRDAQELKNGQNPSSDVEHNQNEQKGLGRLKIVLLSYENILVVRPTWMGLNERANIPSRNQSSPLGAHYCY